MPEMFVFLFPERQMIFFFYPKIYFQNYFDAEIASSWHGLMMIYEVISSVWTESFLCDVRTNLHLLAVLS